MDFFNKLRGGAASKSPKNPSKAAAVEISGPCDWRHEIHVGWDKGGTLQGLPESWKLWMKAANIRYFNCGYTGFQLWLRQIRNWPFFRNLAPAKDEILAGFGRCQSSCS